MEAHKLVQAGKAILIDVREEHEVRESGVAEGAQWMPMSKMDGDEPEWATFKASLPKDKTIFLYCAVGGRSGRVAEFLAQDGYATENLGGFKDLKAAGLPVKKI